MFRKGQISSFAQKDKLDQLDQKLAHNHGKTKVFPW
jgi:hypothetical protein